MSDERVSLFSEVHAVSRSATFVTVLLSHAHRTIQPVNNNQNKVFSSGEIMNTGTRTYLPNPRESAGTFSKIFYIWTIPLFRIGYGKVLELNDLYQPLSVDRSKTLGLRLET